VHRRRGVSLQIQSATTGARGEWCAAGALLPLPPFTLLADHSLPCPRITYLGNGADARNRRCRTGGYPAWVGRRMPPALVSSAPPGPSLIGTTNGTFIP
jgi:hypothetical protein